METLLEAYSDARDDEVAVGNAQARLRTVLNYLVANHENRLALGTGNRTELPTGYLTKYGDGAVDCLPTGNLYKQQVRQLARYVGVPEDIVEKPATAGLWADQTDEDELGMPYDVLDAIPALHLDGPNASALSLRDVEPSQRILLLGTEHHALRDTVMYDQCGPSKRRFDAVSNWVFLPRIDINHPAVPLY